MPGHGKRHKFTPLPGAQISDELRALGLSMGEVSRLTGVNPQRLGQWISGEETASHIFASWLALMRLPGARELAQARADELRIDDADHG